MSLSQNVTVYGAAAEDSVTVGHGSRGGADRRGGSARGRSAESPTPAHRTTRLSTRTLAERPPVAGYPSDHSVICYGLFENSARIDTARPVLIPTGEPARINTGRSVSMRAASPVGINTDRAVLIPAGQYQYNPLFSSRPYQNSVHIKTKQVVCRYSLY